ncbi:hypothetical protein FE810_00440 [Thalassotalea litorea]|uniref:DUF6868 domain-containing protein n=1 Tax=Thalassotalea litorea TaxID=2020715 RepID=A0A5R9IU21_9GAMM|nr:hypothetical protein [Thalassotalea litorea]TLU68119.1 hypothetical protein FE810_00440 [Thalassotalea litorea]
MGDMQNLVCFFGWCAVINFVMLLMATLFIKFAQNWAMNIHSQMFNLDKEALPAMYFKYLGNFKIAAIIFSFTPWLALTLMR